jgi:hypothetical protein
MMPTVVNRGQEAPRRENGLTLQKKEEENVNSITHYTAVGRAINLVVVAVMLASALSAARAAESPRPARGNQSVAQTAAPVAEVPVEATAGMQEARQVDVAFASLLPLRNNLGRYGIYRPASWYTIDLSDDRSDGILITTDPQDHSTYLSIEVTDNALAVTDTDLPWLIQSFRNQLELRPGAQIELQNQYMQGTAWVFEAKYTYPNKDDEGRRWIRVIYTGARKYVVVAEAPSHLDYAAAEPVFEAMMATFRVN